MELGVIVGGRWRTLCPLTGRVLGWRRRPKLVMVQDGSVQGVPLSALFNVVPGPRLYSSPSPPPPEHRCSNVDGAPKPASARNEAGGQVAADLESRRSSRGACVNADNQRAWGGWSPLLDMRRHVGVQTDDERCPSRAMSRDAGVKTAWRGRHVGVQTNEENRCPAKKTGDAHTAPASRAAGEGAGGAGGEGDCRELLVDAEAVRLLRRYARYNDTGIDLKLFDRDDRYKALVFFRLNPLVRVERCPKIAKLLQDRDNPQATEYFARQLGLCSTVDNGSEARAGDASKHEAGGRKQRSCQGSLVSKRNSRTIWREYSVQEDRVVLRWLLGEEWRGRCVSGNRLWRELEPAFPALAGTRRSWHSLRNRYLRYLLPALDSPALQLSPSAARRLREGAALGEMRARRRQRCGSPPSAPAPRGAFSRAPPAVRRLVPSPRAPTAMRPAQGGHSSQAQRAPPSSGVQQAPRVPRSPRVQQSPRMPRPPRGQQSPRVPRSPRVQQSPRRSPRLSQSLESPRSLRRRRPPGNSTAAANGSPRAALPAAPRGKRRLYNPWA